MENEFDHERLDVYRLAVEVARWFGATPFPRGRGELHRQGQDAADSVVLNIAEGAGRWRARAAGKNHHQIALGSAAEACAVLDLVPAVPGVPDTQQKLRRIGAMLAKMSR
ncbi:MAG: four helix bundle protein [Deltaproteobacteria bacterium]|jgi:four helix bundle protein|nr:four helix bundle protein [Deltaproteobacteria bacterium]MBW2535309.1 four helix bundle protein [Deltaproteobacteria bacterium]